MTVWLHVGTRHCGDWDEALAAALGRRGILPRKVSATGSAGWLDAVAPGDRFLGRFNEHGLEVKPGYRAIAERFHWRVWPDERALHYYDRKDLQAGLLDALGVPHPRTAWLRGPDDLDRFTAGGGVAFPLVKKPVHGSRSRGVALVSGPEHLRYPCLVQEYCPGNDCDYRYNCEGGRVFGLRRLVRPGDFRASGSGRLERLAELDPGLVGLTAAAARRLGMSSLAFDWIRHPDGRWVATEFSYTYDLPGTVAHCDHYVDAGGRVEARPLDPAGYVVADFLGAAMTFTVVVTVFGRESLVPRVLFAVSRQAWRDWELVFVADGPHPLVGSILEDFREVREDLVDRIRYVVLPRVEGTWGNIARRRGLELAAGDYTVFLGHDCLLAPGYLAAHAANVAEVPGCLSLVDIDCWVTRVFGAPEVELPYPQYLGVRPARDHAVDALEIGEVDLTCMAFPTARALELGVFAGDPTVYCADYYDAYLACNKAMPVIHRPGVVAAHF